MSSETILLCGHGHLSKRVAIAVRKHAVTLVNYTDPGCGCGWGCAPTRDCPSNKRHWFCGPNRGCAANRDLAQTITAELARLQKK